MTNEEAKRRLEVWLKCMDCPEDKQCYDSHLHSTCEYTDYCDETPVSEAVKVAIKALEQTTWIPCSERLPEDFQRVLVTIVNYAGNKVVRVAEYYNYKGVFQIKENNEHWKIGEKGLLAWMPLPESYKGE